MALPTLAYTKERRHFPCIQDMVFVGLKLPVLAGLAVVFHSLRRFYFVVYKIDDVSNLKRREAVSAKANSSGPRDGFSFQQKGASCVLSCLKCFPLLKTTCPCRGQKTSSEVGVLN